MFSSNYGMVFILILLILFNFTGEDGINSTESAVLIMAMLAILFTTGNLFDNHHHCCCNGNN